MSRLSRWFAVAAVLFLPLSAGAQGCCQPAVMPAPAVALYTPAPAVSFYAPAVSYSVAVPSYSMPAYGYAPSYYYTPAYSYGYAPSYAYGGYGYGGYGYRGYGYGGYNPGGLGGPYSGLGVRPGLGLGGFGLRR